MLLLISDANILMDVEVGDLVAPMFSLEYQFAVPDILYYEELEDQHAHLVAYAAARRLSYGMCNPSCKRFTICKLNRRLRFNTSETRPLDPI